MRCGNLFVPVERTDEEFLEVLEDLENLSGLRVERIVSEGHASPEGFWYDQGDPEWVALIQGAAELEFEDGRRRPLKAGDWLTIPAHERHRVAYTSSDPPCVWIAVFGIGGMTCGDVHERDGG